MKMTIAAAGLAALMATGASTAWADDPEMETKAGHWYVEGGYHYGQLEAYDVSETTTVGLVGANVGYQFGNGWGVEATFAQGVVEEDITVLTLEIPVKAGSWYGIALKYTEDVGDKGTAFMKLRGTSVEIGAEGPGFTISETEFEVGWSIGGTYALTDQAYSIVELNQFMETHLGLFVGVGMKF